MTRENAISAREVDAQALHVAEQHAIWLLGGRRDADPGLSAALDALPGAALCDMIARFALSADARDALLIAAAVELGPGGAAALAAHPLNVAGAATPALIDAALPGLAAETLAPDGLLRRAALLDLAPGPGFAHRPLALAETALHFLRGAPCLDDGLAAILSPAHAAGAAPDWAARLARALALARDHAPQPLLHLDAPDPWLAARQAAGALGLLGLGAWRLDAGDAPRDTAAAARVARLIDRDMALLGAGLVAVAAPGEDPAPLHRLLERVHAPAILIGGPAPEIARPPARFAPPRDPVAGVQAWTEALGAAATGIEPEIAAVARHFSLPAPALRAAAQSVALGLESRLWPLARDEAGRALDGLAERIRPTARWADLALPPAQRRQLEQIAAFRKTRDQVNRDWGFAAKSPRGLGLAALFSGASGTGKTMAAEIVAAELGPGAGPEAGGLDLFRVDLSAIVSKYIGETEKNIARIFDAAQAAGAVLIFDEGDALFGKRTAEVKDSIDRHSNNETAYLLQRLEAYDGVAIVTTNLRESVDEAFLRRFRFVVEFPFPDAAHREAIWQSVLPESAPVENLDFKALARLSLSGGAIRSIALTAAYLAAGEGAAISMAHMRAAARQEYAKLGKTLGESDLRGRRR